MPIAIGSIHTYSYLLTTNAIEINHPCRYIAMDPMISLQKKWAASSYKYRASNTLSEPPFFMPKKSGAPYLQWLFVVPLIGGR